MNSANRRIRLYTKFFYVNCAPSQYRYKTPIQSESFTRKPRRSELFWAFWSAAAKAVMANCRPPDYTAWEGLHIADGAEPWCGPARRLADPCVARTSGAPSRALFHSPVPGPGHATRYSANVPWRPRFSQLHPCRWRPREPACPTSAPSRVQLHSPPDQTAPR